MITSFSVTAKVVIECTAKKAFCIAAGMPLTHDFACRSRTHVITSVRQAVRVLGPYKALGRPVAGRDRLGRATYV